MDRYSVPLRYIADDAVTGKRIAAFCEFDLASCLTVNDYTARRISLRRLCDNLLGLGLYYLLDLYHAVKLIAEL